LLKFGRTLASIAAVFYTVKNAMAVFQTGYEFNAMLEDTKLSLAGLLSSLYSYKDATGKIVSTQEAFNMAMGDAVIIQEKLRYAGLTTAATYDQLMRGMTQAMAPAANAGVPLGNMVDFVQRFVQIAQVAQVPMEQLGEEFRSFLTGVMQPRMTRVQPFMESIGLTNVKIRELIGTGQLYNNFMENSKNIAIMAAIAFNNWSVVISNLKDAFQNSMGSGTIGSFEALKQSMISVFNWMVTFNDETKKVTLNENLISAIKRADAGIIGLIETTKEFVKLIDDFNTAHPVLTQFAADVGIILIKITALVIAIKAIGWGFALIGGVALSSFKYIISGFVAIGAAIATVATKAAAIGATIMGWGVAGAAMTAWGWAAAAAIATLILGVGILAAEIAPGLIGPIWEVIKNFEILGSSIQDWLDIFALMFEEFGLKVKKVWANIFDLDILIAGIPGFGGGMDKALSDFNTKWDTQIKNVRNKMEMLRNPVSGTSGISIYEGLKDSTAKSLQGQPKDKDNLWDDKNIKALQTASSLIVTFNQRLSSISGNSMSQIVSDFAKMNDQIDKTIYKMEKEAKASELSVSYAKQLKDIRDQITIQELEKRNREIYAYSLEGVPETRENQYKKAINEYDEFIRKLVNPPSAGAMDELYGDPILKMVENAKDALAAIEGIGKKVGQEIQTVVDDLNISLDKMRDKIETLFTIKPSGFEELIKQFKDLTGGGTSNDPLAKYLKGAGFDVKFIDLDIVSPLQEGIQKSLNTKGVNVTMPPGSVQIGVGNDRSIRNNNPGNIEFRPWQQKYGAVLEEPIGYANPAAGKGGPRFSKFPTPELGYEALLELVGKYQESNMTITKMIETYAPRFENDNVNKRIQQMTSFFGVSSDTNIAGLSKNSLAQMLASQDSGTKIVGEFQKMQGAADANRKVMLGGQTDKEMADRKLMYNLSKIDLADKLKIDEIMKSSYGTLIAMNIPAEKQNEYAKEALNFELMIDHTKTLQLIGANKLDGVNAENLLKNNYLLSIEKERAENINQQNRPLEQQNTWLNEINKHTSSLASNSLLYTDQLRYQEESLNIQQKVSLNELEIWIKKNEYALKSAGFDEDRLRNLHKQNQEAEKLQLEMKKWETQGFAGGAKIYGVERQNEAAKRGAADFKALMDNLESGIGDMAGSAFIDSIRGKKVILEDMFWDLGGTFVKQIMKMGVSRGFDLIGGLLNPVKSNGKEEGGFLSSLFGKGSLGTKKNPMYVEIANMEGIGKGILPESNFDRTMQRMDKTAYSFGGKKDSGLGGYAKLMKQAKQYDKLDDSIFREERKETKTLEKENKKLYKRLFGEEDAYQQMIQERIDLNQESFQADYLTDYENSFTGMAENITSVWGLAQGIMTAAGVSGEVARYGAMVQYGMQGISLIMQLAKAQILIDAYRGAASAYAWVMKIVPPPANFPLAVAAAALTFAAISAYGAFGGVTSGIGGGSGGGLGSSPGMTSTGAGYTEGYHTGGVVGYSVAHAGLMIDERMIKAQVGEGIIKRSTMDLYSRKGISFDMLNNGQVGGESVSSDNSTNIDKIAVSVNINNPPKDFNADKLAKQLVPALQKQIKLNRLRVPTK